MKVLFLGIDGVINTFPNPSTVGDFNKKACAQLNRLLEAENDLKIVISSSWRVYGLDAVKDILEHNGISSEAVIGCTGDIKATIMEEIEDWLDQNTDITTFVILDNEKNFGNLSPHLVRTNSFTGITARDVKAVSKILNKYNSLH